MHKCLDVVAVKYVHDTPRSVFDINQSKKVLQRHPICLTDPDHDYIFEEIECIEKKLYEINIRNNGDEE